MDRNGRAALVTGAARRIGRAIAFDLAALGYDIALHYHGSEKLARESAEGISRTGVRCEVFRCDLADRADVSSMLERVTGIFPELSLLVNNASIFNRSPIRETGTEFLARQFEVNFFAPFVLSRDFAVRCGHGLIINLLDTRIDSSDAAYAAYSLSKKALAAFTRMAALEFAPEIRVNAVAPGLILEPEDEGEDYLDRLARKLPLKRKGSVENVVDAVRSLVSNEFVTGQIIYVDGGESLR